MKNFMKNYLITQAIIYDINKGSLLQFALQQRIQQRIQQRRWINSGAVITRSTVTHFGPVHKPSGFNHKELVDNLEASRALVKAKYAKLQIDNSVSVSANTSASDNTNVAFTTQNMTLKQEKSITLYRNLMEFKYNKSEDILDLPERLNGFTADIILRSKDNTLFYLSNCSAHIDSLLLKISDSRLSLLQSCTELNGMISITKAISSRFERFTTRIPCTDDLLAKLLSHSDRVYALALDNYHATFSNLSAYACIEMLPRIREITLNLNSIETVFIHVEQIFGQYENMVRYVEGWNFLSAKLLDIQDILVTVCMISG